MNYMQYDGTPQYGFPGQTPEQAYAQQQAFPPQYPPFTYTDPYANPQQPAYGPIYPQQPEYPRQPAYGQYPAYEQPAYEQPAFDPFAYERQFEQPAFEPVAYETQNPYDAPWIPARQAGPAEAPQEAASPAKGKKNKESKFKKLLNQEEKPDTAGKKILRMVTNAGFWILCIALLAGSVLFMLSKDPNKNYFGYRAYNVKSNSMAPNADGSSPPGGFYKGDAILVQMCAPTEVKEGDIVTFNPNPNDPKSTAFLTHRVVRILNELGGKQGLFFVTKGDHNKSEDPPIAAASIIGKKVAMVPKVGAALELIRKNLTIAVVAIIALFGSVLMLQWYFAKPDPNAKPKKARTPKQDDPEPGPAPAGSQAPHPIQSVLPG